MFFHSSNTRSGTKSGFTLIEMIIVLGIIIVITLLVFTNFNTFTSRSNLRIRTSEIVGYIRFAQERSASSEHLPGALSSTPTIGFQVVRLKVRDGVLQEYRLEKVPGKFSSFSATVAQGSADFHAQGQVAVSDARHVILDGQETYYVNVCFIDTNSTAVYQLEPLETKPATVNRCSKTPKTTDRDLFCELNNPSTSEGRNEMQRNNFDIHLSIEQPTREVHANIFAVRSDGSTYQYTNGGVRPNGTSNRISGMYEGLRIALITPTGEKRSIDVYHTGLVSTKANDARSGCGVPPITGLTAQLTASSVSLEWKHTSPDVTGYKLRIKKGSYPFDLWTGITPARNGNNRTHTVTTVNRSALTLPTSYTFEVRPVIGSISAPAISVQILVPPSG